MSRNPCRWLPVLLVMTSCAAVAFAGRPHISSKDPLFVWMRVHHVRAVCVTYEVTKFDPASARIVEGTGNAKVDAMVLEEIRLMGRTWVGREGQVIRRYTKSPQIVPMSFGVNLIGHEERSTWSRMACNKRRAQQK